MAQINLRTQTVIDEIFKGFNKFKEFFSMTVIAKTVQTIIALVLLYLAYRIVRKYILRFAEKKLTSQSTLLIRKVLKYIFQIVVIIYVLNLFGVKLHALLGAAGIVGIAVGFAAQTSVSNIISGFFILSDQSIKIGDFVTLKDITGRVHSIDLMSIKILTTNNQLIRVPNETVLQSNMQNNTFFPTRRMIFNIAISYDTDIEKAKKILEAVPVTCQTALTEPAPSVNVDSFGASGINLMLAVWFKKEDYWNTRNTMFINIKKAFDTAGIVIPFNQLDVQVKESMGLIERRTNTATHNVEKNTTLTAPKQKGLKERAKAVNNQKI
ncbi:MAG TPA: mechanosensitive ion channel family protein [Treponemataceae bacterium]|nr:mechanosensitive ion channel family protein [Treponemataceae bacterium]